MKNKFSIILILIACFGLNSYGQKFKKMTLPTSFAKGVLVIPKFNANLVSFENVNNWSGRHNYKGTLFKDGQGNYSLGIDWKNRGWALMHEFAVQKIDRDRNNNIVLFRSTSTVITLTIDSGIENLEEALNAMFFVGSIDDFKRSEYYQQEIVDRFLPIVFKDKLGALSFETKMRMVEAVHFNTESIKGEDFKGKFYLAINAGTDDVFYNTNQVNQSERTARTFEKLINAGIKQGTGFENVPEIEGLKISLRVGYSDFLREGQFPTNWDEIQVYFLFEHLKQFKGADITNQQLVDKSVVLVNGNRVQVSLTQFK
jgi:hypothetical protein